MLKIYKNMILVHLAQMLSNLALPVAYLCSRNDLKFDFPLLYIEHCESHHLVSVCCVQRVEQLVLDHSTSVILQNQNLRTMLMARPIESLTFSIPALWYYVTCFFYFIFSVVKVCEVQRVQAFSDAQLHK